MRTKGFSKALLYHIQVKVQLKKFLEGKGSFNVAELSQEDCNFGKWLCSDEINQYASKNEIAKLKKVHEKLHNSVRRVYGLKMLDDEVGARKELEKVEAVSMKLVSLMSILKTIKNN